MRITLTDVTKGRRGAALPKTSTSFESGQVTLVVAETEQRPSVLGLIASGRMRPDAGAVQLDGRTDAAALRRAVALVDAPEVSDPPPNVSVAGLVSEELMFAGRRSDPFAARTWLDGHGLRPIASTPLADVEPEARLRMLCDLALLRRGVSGLVVVSPDRHGGDPRAWWRLLRGYADDGTAVLAIVGTASVQVLEQSQEEQVTPAAAPSRAALGALAEREAAWAQSAGAVEEARS